MPPTRLTIAPSNTAGHLDGTDVMESILTEVDGLWQHALVPLTALSGTNSISASCVVPIAANRVGHQFSFLPPAANTGNVELNVDTRGALPLRDASGAELPSGYLNPARLETCINMGAEYRLTMPNAGLSGTTTLRAVLALQQATNVNGGSATGGTRQRYPFNTIISNNIPGLSLDTVTNIGRITVPARAYDRIEARCLLYDVGANNIYLRNISDAVDVSEQVSITNRSEGPSACLVRTTLAATKQMELQYYCASSNAGDGLGRPVNDPGGRPEQYGFIEFISRG
jgi:hypothetical protein